MVKRLAATLAEGSLRSGVPEAVFAIATQIDRDIALCLDAGADATGLLIRTADFGQVFTWGQDRLAAGRLDTLPAGHRLRAVLPAVDYVHVEAKPVLLLGRMIGPAVARPFYPEPLALELTRAHRQRQRA